MDILWWLYMVNVIMIYSVQWVRVLEKAGPYRNYQTDKRAKTPGGGGVKTPDPPWIRHYHTSADLPVQRSTSGSEQTITRNLPGCHVRSSTRTRPVASDITSSRRPKLAQAFCNIQPLEDTHVVSHDKSLTKGNVVLRAYVQAYSYYR